MIKFWKEIVNLNEEDVKGKTTDDIFFGVIMTKRVTKEHEDMIVDTLAVQPEISDATKGIKKDSKLLRNVSKIFRLFMDVWTIGVFIKKGEDFIEISGEKSKVMDLSKYDLIELEPLSDYYKENEVRFNHFDSTMRLDLDRLEPVEEYNDKMENKEKENGYKVLTHDKKK